MNTNTLNSVIVRFYNAVDRFSGVHEAFVSATRFDRMENSSYNEGSSDDPKRYAMVSLRDTRILRWAIKQRRRQRGMKYRSS
jgi:hypothetical protein